MCKRRGRDRAGRHCATNVGSDDRGVSEVLGFSLVFTIVLASVVIISVAGVSALEQTRNAEQVNNAERAFDVLADNVADIHQDGAPSRATEMSLSQAELFTDHNVTVNVTATTGTGAVTVERQLRPVVYRAKNDATLTYEGGAIFRVDESGGSVLRAPPIMANDERSVITIVAPQAPHRRGIGSATVLVRTTENQRTVDIANVDGSYSDVYVNVTSPHYQQWQTILSDGGLEDCTTGTDAAGDSFVTCSLNPASTIDSLYVTTVSMDITLER